MSASRAMILAMALALCCVQVNVHGQSTYTPSVVAYDMCMGTCCAYPSRDTLELLLGDDERASREALLRHRHYCEAVCAALHPSYSSVAVR